MSPSIEHSRALLLGADATGLSSEGLERRLEESLVVVRVEPGISGALLTAHVLLTTLRRQPGRLALDHSGLSADQADALEGAVLEIDSKRGLTISDTPEPTAAINILIGVTALDGWLRVIPDGYGAHLLADSDRALRQHRPANALGSIFAAAVAGAEAFKYTAGVLDSRCTRHRELIFCPVTVSSRLDAAPDLPRDMELNTTLIGNGAIGTAEALILAELGLGGHIIVCDPEKYGPENRGTYSLGGEREANTRPPKVDVTSAALTRTGYKVRKVKGPSTDYIALIDDGELVLPDVILTALDSAEARRGTQDLWADYIIDAQTGDTAVGLCVATPDGPCLHCFFPASTRGPSSIERLAALTGLPVDRLARGDDPLTESDLEPLSDEQRALLRAHLGQPVCGLASAVGLTDVDDHGYMPSVPFVSQMAACLAVGRLLALLMGLDAASNWFQFDALHGPTSEPELWKPSPSCQCQTHSHVVERIRAARLGRA